MSDRHEQLIVGREQEIEAVRALVDDATAGTVLVLVGEAGIGKTTLLDVVCARAERDGMRYHRASAHQYDAHPFALLARLPGDPLLERELLDLVDVVVHPAHDNPSSLFDVAPIVPMMAVDRLLASLDPSDEDGADRSRSGRPALVVLDDLQWADPASLVALVPLLRLAATNGLAVALAYRPFPAVPEVDRLLDSVPASSLRTFRVGPLRPEDASRLLALRLGGVPGEAWEPLAARAGGNPFYLTELARTLEAAGATGPLPPDAAGGTGRSGATAVVAAADAVPAELRELVLRRIRQLGAPAEEVLRVAAVLGRHLAIEDLVALTGRRVTELMPLLAGAVSAGVLIDDGGELAFRHDLVAEALVLDTPIAVRRALHREVATVQSERGASPERVARHLLLGAEPGDRRVVTSLVDLADRAMAPVACDLLSRAYEVVEPADPIRDRISVLLVERLVEAGRAQDALEMSARALEVVTDPVTRVLLRAARCHGLFVSGRAADAVALWAEEPIDRAHPDGALLELAQLALARLFAGDPVGARGDATAALACRDDALAAIGLPSDPLEIRARDAGEVEVHAAMAHGVLAFLEGVAGRFTDAEAHGARGVELARRDTSAVRFRYAPHLFHAAVLDGMADPRAPQVLADGRRHSEEHGFRMHLPLFHALAAINLFRSGDWDLAVGEARSGVDAAAELMSASSFADHWLASVTSMVATYRNDLAGADAALARSASSTSAIGQDWGALARALLLEAQGDPAGAADLLGPLFELLAAVGVRSAQLYLGPDAVRLAQRIGDPDRADRIVDALGWVDDGAPPVAQAIVAWCRGQGAGDVEMLTGAADELDRCGRPFDAAQARHAAAVAVAPADQAAARLLGRTALVRYTELGAELVAARLRADLRVSGIQLRAPAAADGGPGTATYGWEALTPTERKIVALVVEGLSNAAIAERLVVSRRTVESHLARIYDKVGVRTRGLLAREASTRSDQLAD